MAQSARDEIFGRLKGAPSGTIPPRPDLPPLNELSLNREGMVRRFTESLVAETAVVHRVKDSQAVLDKLSQIVKEEGLKKIMVSTDEVISLLNLSDWGKEHGLKVMTSENFLNRDSFKEAIFNEVDAGITGVDFAVAETGTLVLVHDKDQPRLLSLAPILHIAIVPVEKFVPVYEQAIEKVFSQPEKIPSQISFISGPSMTADIQATAFKGMHGPRQLIVILIG